MASARALAWTERLAWILIYSGLFMLVLGLVAMPQSAGTGWSLVTVGALLAIAGVILVWLRSRLE
jgi:hypothetical protein